MTSLSPQTNADFVRLEHARSCQQLSEALKSLLERGEALDRVVEIIERKIDPNDAYVLAEQLADLIVRTKSGSLYAKTRNQLFGHDWVLLSLYQSGYPDPDIEKHLCTLLYEIASNDTEPKRRAIADAMGDVGSESVLPILKAILHDLAPSVEVKEMIVQAIESAGVSSGEAMLKKFEAGSRGLFVTSVTKAIAAIEGRATALKASRRGEEVSLPSQEKLEAENPRQSQAIIPTGPLIVDQLKDIELQLHSHIKRRLQERYGTEKDAWWVEGIPLTIRQDCAQRREQDRARQELFNYTYLIDLKTVLDKNWSLFEPDFAKIRTMVSSKKDFLDQITGLNEVRNRHFHPIRAPEPGSKALVDDHSHVSKMARTVAIFCNHATE